MLSVRRATESDAELLSELGARLFVQAFGARNTVEDMRLYLAGSFTAEGWHAALGDPWQRVWIAEDSKELGSESIHAGESTPTPIPPNVAAGYAVLKRADAPIGVAEGRKRPIEIARLYADETWHGRGVGAALMTACLVQAKEWNGDVVWLGVWDANTRAIAFYEKHGFQIVAAQTFQLGNDLQRDHVMTRELD